MSDLRSLSRPIDVAEAARLQCAARDRGDLLVWTVYDHPSDYPQHFAVRPFSSRAGGVPSDCVLLFPHLRDARRVMARMGLACLARNEADDQVIVETWL